MIRPTVAAESDHLLDSKHTTSAKQTEDKKQEIDLLHYEFYIYFFLWTVQLLHENS